MKIEKYIKLKKKVQNNVVSNTEVMVLKNIENLKQNVKKRTLHLLFITILINQVDVIEIFLRNLELIMREINACSMTFHMESMEA